MEELKDYILDKISYLENYYNNNRLICYGPSEYEINIRRKTLQDVLDKLREIEKGDKE